MIAEIAHIEIDSERLPEFEAAMKVAVSTVLSKAHGFRDFQLLKGIERPSVYTFIIHWESLEDHIVGFRESHQFVEWRELIGHFFAHPPVVEHWSPLFSVNA